MPRALPDALVQCATENFCLSPAAENQMDLAEEPNKQSHGI